MRPVPDPPHTHSCSAALQLHGRSCLYHVGDAISLVGVMQKRYRNRYDPTCDVQIEKEVLTELGAGRQPVETDDVRDGRERRETTH